MPPADSPKAARADGLLRLERRLFGAWLQFLCYGWCGKIACAILVSLSRQHALWLFDKLLEVDMLSNKYWAPDYAVLIRKHFSWQQVQDFCIRTGHRIEVTISTVLANGRPYDSYIKPCHFLSMAFHPNNSSTVSCAGERPPSSRNEHLWYPGTSFYSDQSEAGSYIGRTATAWTGCLSLLLCQ